MAVSELARGAKALCEFADEIDEICIQTEGHKRILRVDIGGGLSANYTGDDIFPSFQDYVHELVKLYPTFLNQQRVIMTGMCIN